MEDKIKDCVDQIFLKFDADKNGVLDTAEARKAIVAQLEQQGQKITEEKIIENFKLLDLNDDGEISRDEVTTVITELFKALMQALK